MPELPPDSASGYIGPVTRTGDGLLLHTDSAVSEPPAAAPQAEHSSTEFSVPLVHQAIETLQTVVTALMLAFMFRSFMIEPFIIPTGSMAQSLLGEHATKLCQRCGLEFDYGPQQLNARPGEAFRGGLVICCPNCHLSTDLDEPEILPKAGDRILVHKWPYLLMPWLGPRRWDVIVFRDPADPAQNIIKRLAALPGESIEIIDGDVYITPAGESEAHIARKTGAAQSQLWFVCYDQNHAPNVGNPLSASWAWAPLEMSATANLWSGLDTREISFAGSGADEGSLHFAPVGSNAYLQDFYAYNRGPSQASYSGAPPYIGDVRVFAEVIPRSQSGSVCWSIDRDGAVFAASMSWDGDGVSVELAGSGAPRAGYLKFDSRRARLPYSVDRSAILFELGHVDYRVYVSVAGHELISTDDADYGPDLERIRDVRRAKPPGLWVTARGGALALRGLRVDRDVHYTYKPHETRRATINSAFQLGAEEYFVLGDNSPASFDSRDWQRVGPHLIDAEAAGTYQIGTVPANQIVGRAFFVYLPGLQPIGNDGRWRFPDMGRTRFIR